MSYEARCAVCGRKYWQESSGLAKFTGVAGAAEDLSNAAFLGAGVKLLHANHSYNDLMPGAEVGYAFFINRSVTIEPALYYDQSFKKSDYSTVGLKVGLGIYLFDD